jgi:uncharacterized protein YjbJ (UPF0337 family)
MDDILEGKWKQIRGKVKEWWGNLTDDDLDRVEGKSERLLGLLQEKYGYTRQRAEDELNRRLREYDAQYGAAPGAGHTTHRP